MKIVEELAKQNFLEQLESECENSVDFVKRQVSFCARWSLDNLCKLSRCLCPVYQHSLLKKSFFSVKHQCSLLDLCCSFLLETFSNLLTDTAA